MGALDRTLWLENTHSKNEKSRWVCPQCQKGVLSLKDNDVMEIESSYTKKASKHVDFDHDWVRNYYSAVFHCNNEICGEVVVCTGNMTYQTHYDYDTKGIHQEWLEVIYEPLFFVPSLKILQIPESVNSDIRGQIEKSFSHYFNDTSAAANSIRTALELIMNDQKVKKTTINAKNNRVEINLHTRIDIFSKKNDELKPFLIAAKWIGNAGSHISNITKEDLLDGYELLEHCLDELYDKPARIKGLSAKAKSINSSKKPRSAKKMK